MGDKSNSLLLQKRISKALVFAKNNRRLLTPEFSGVSYSQASLLSRNIAEIVAGCCVVTAAAGDCSIPGLVDNFSLQHTTFDGSGPYIVGYDLSWNATPGATSYNITSNMTDLEITFTSETSASIVGTWDASENVFIYITAVNACGSGPESELENAPCFLAGSLVALVGGIMKAIEDVIVGDIVIGAFGELNPVLALHRPLLGDKLMCNINNEHSTTNHHPHVSVDRKFYCGDPSTVSAATYGRYHIVLDEFGNSVERFLHGLKPERINKLHEGIHLKTLTGGKVVETIETYSLPPDTQLYNLVVGGSHTYHVDGYAVTGWPREDDFDYDTWRRR